MVDEAAGRRPKALGIIGAALGLALFVYSVRNVGLARIAADIRAIGLGFVLILAISGVRELIRTATWRLCTHPPGQLPFGSAFVARLIGEALGNVTPFGLLVSEPAKAALVRHRVPLVTAFSALAVDQILYTVSVLVMITAGMVTMLAAFVLPDTLETIGLASIGAAAVAAAALAWVAARRPAISDRVMRVLGRFGVGTALLHRAVAPARDMESRIYAFAGEGRGRLLPIAALLAAFHAFAVLEVYVTMTLITGAPPLLVTAFVLETVNRMITVIFKFVPLRLGVDEVGTGLMTNVLHLGTPIGVTMALVRKARVLCWAAVGVGLLLQRGLTLRELGVGRQASGDGGGPQD